MERRSRIYDNQIGTNKQAYEADSGPKLLIRLIRYEDRSLDAFLQGRILVSGYIVNPSDYQSLSFS